MGSITIVTLSWMSEMQPVAVSFTLTPMETATEWQGARSACARPPRVTPAKIRRTVMTASRALGLVQRSDVTE